MEKQKLNFLLRKYASKKADTHEIRELFAFLSGQEELSESLIAESIEQHESVDELSWSELKEWLDEIVYVDRTGGDTSPVVALSGVGRLYKWMAAAAVLLLLVGLAYLLSGKLSFTGDGLNLAGQLVGPGKEGAVLTLANGNMVSLDTIADGRIALQDGIIARVKNGALFYEGTGNGNNIFNILTIPKGRQFHLFLPDGTQVWLNSQSSIRYPLTFSDNKRNVEVTGEAYFEVAQQAKQPFVVRTASNVIVEVLGTQFNVKAYQEDGLTQTTLLQGSVRVSADTTGTVRQSVLLKPGQQAAVEAGATGKQKMRVWENVDLEKVTAWKNGLFNFNDVPLTEVMRQLARWYDIEVVYENGVPDVQLLGEMTKDVSLNDLMVVLEKVGVHYRIQGRRLVVLP